jgi:chromate transporter
MFSWNKAAMFLLVGLGVGFSAIFLISNPVLHEMGKFFTKAALVTFGGAYAVLPYVYQGGVEQYGWLTANQMIDGLALGETTPGPLIMVVAFVGFVGAVTKEVFGADATLLSGLAGASVATLFTFLPSFMFIFLGGPGVEATRGNLKFSAPLSAVTAAVVGVIVNLAFFFAEEVIWPSNIENLDWSALAIGFISFVLLFKNRLGIMSVIAGSALIGIIIVLLKTLI